jgi:NitT/TauT family transport system ATP-binding protein
MSSISIRNLSQSYVTETRTVHAISKVSLDICDGEFVCVVGPSGCGKTTLLNILGGFVEPTGGEIRIDGIARRDANLNIGVVFLEYALFPWRTALGNVEYGLEIQKLPKAERRERAMHYLQLVHLEEAANTYPHHLSGGMRQRVAVARALAYDPALLLMDEPFGALDTQTREHLQELTEEIWLTTRKTVFYVTHNLSEAVYLGERVVVMHPAPGRVHKIVTIDLPRPRDPLSAGFVDIQRDVTEAIRHAGAPRRQETSASSKSARSTIGAKSGIKT